MFVTFLTHSVLIYIIILYPQKLTVDEECAQKRGGFGEERYEKIEFQRKVKSIYQQLAEESPQVFPVFAIEHAKRQARCIFHL